MKNSRSIKKGLVCIIIVMFVCMSVVPSSGITNGISEKLEPNKENIILGNHPPYAPNIKGPRLVKPRTTYKWTFKAIDPDGDNVSYIIDWGDGTFEGWTEWYPSGEEITRSHTYEYYMQVMIIAKAKDIHGAEGPEGTLPIEVLLSKQITTFLFLRFLEQFPNALPIIRYLLEANS